MTQPLPYTPYYEVAVIQDGKILKVYPQEVYNKHIIEQYRSQGLHNLPSYEPSMGDERLLTQLTEPNQTLMAGIQKHVVNPLNALTVSLLVVMIFVLAMALLYSKKTSNKIRLGIANLVIALIGGVGFLLFFKNL